jgi:protein-L-isoaspartate(D-aspartate) O-methyltransferase
MNTRIAQAFEAVDRRLFLPAGFESGADIDAPISIGYGQTNSQPSTVRMMLEWLDPQPGDKILDVGSGSGWTTGLLAHLVVPKGEVYAVEKVPELVKFGVDNCKKAGVHNVRFFETGQHYGLGDFAPYDRILVSAAAKDVPQELLVQLKIGGRLVIPVRNSIYVINKTGDDSYETTEHPGFVFVPLI